MQILWPFYLLVGFVDFREQHKPQVQANGMHDSVLITRQLAAHLPSLGLSQKITCMCLSWCCVELVDQLSN